MVILLKTLKSIWKFSSKCGLVLFTYTLMFIAAISLFSLVNKGTVYYGNRCNSTINQRAIEYLNQEEIIAYDYELNCNTLYLDLNVNDDLNEKQIKTVIIRISNYYKEINFSVDTQIIIKNSKYLILASLVNHEISLSVSTL